MRPQLELALLCLKDHAAGRCPQIPYYSISLLAAGVAYLADQLDFIPDFLPRLGMIDDALVMEVACEPRARRAAALLRLEGHRAGAREAAPGRSLKRPICFVASRILFRGS